MTALHLYSPTSVRLTNLTVSWLLTMGGIVLLSIVSSIVCVDVSSVELYNHDIVGGGLPELEQLKMASSPAIRVIELSGWFIIEGGSEDDIK